MLKQLFAGFAALCISPAWALDLPEAVINAGLAHSYPRDVKGFHLSDPKIELRDGVAVFCALAQPKIYPRNLHFCASFRPEWHQETGSLHATHVQLTDFSAEGLSSDRAELARQSMNLLLPLLDGMRIYSSRSWIGEQVTAVKVSPGRLGLEF